MKAKQIPLQINFSKGHRFDDYYAGESAEVVARLRDITKNQTAAEIFYIYGPKGSGKSHLAESLCAEASSAGRSAVSVSLAELCEFIRLTEQLPSDLFGAFMQNDILCVDDFESIKQLSGEKKRFLEEQLFDLLNRQILTSRFTLVVFSSVQLPSMSIDLADLQSRLALANRLQLLAFSDEDLVEILCFKSKKIGLEMPEEVAQFLVKRLPRNMHQLADTIDVLDKYSLASSRRLTIPMIKEALQL